MFRSINPCKTFVRWGRRSAELSLSEIGNTARTIGVIPSTGIVIHHSWSYAIGLVNALEYQVRVMYLGSFVDLGVV